MSSSARFGCHRPQQGHRDHVRPQPHVELGRAESSLGGGHDQVAGKGKPEPPRHGPPLHPGHGGLAELPQLVEEGGQPAPGPMQVGERGRPPESSPPGIMPDRSAPAQKASWPGTSQHHDPYRWIVLGLGHPRPQAGDHPPGHGVAPLRTVDGQGEHRPVLRHQHLVGGRVSSLGHRTDGSPRGACGPGPGAAADAGQRPPGTRSTSPLPWPNPDRRAALLSPGRVRRSGRRGGQVAGRPPVARLRHSHRGRSWVCRPPPPRAGPGRHRASRTGRAG